MTNHLVSWTATDGNTSDRGDLPIERRVAEETAEWLVAATAFVAISILAALVYSDLRHWFLVPTTAAGVLAAKDGVRCLLRRADIFSPRSLASFGGIHFFYLVPVLHVVLDYWPLYLTPLSDWRENLGTLALLNLIGLLAYRTVLLVPTRRPAPKVQLDEQRFGTYSTVAISLSLLAWLAVVAQFGGPIAYWSSLANSTADLTGFGAVLLVAESWPLIFGVAVILLRRVHWRAHPGQLILLMGIIAVLIFATGGLRGSRANTVWPLLILLTLIHLVVRPIKRRTVALLAVAGLTFAWAYGFYKTAGSDVLGLLDGSESLEELTERTDRDWEGLILNDLGRAGMQAILIDRLETADPPLAYGETYLGDVLLFLPQRLHDGQVSSKVAVGTTWLYGEGAYQSAGIASTRIYGLAGEALLNFGYAGPPLAFAVYGALVRFFDSYYLQALRARSLAAAPIAAALSPLAVLLLISDLDNAFSFGLRRIVPILAIVWLSTRPRAAVHQVRSGHSRNA